MEINTLKAMQTMQNNHHCTIRALITDIEAKTSKNGNAFAAITFTDGTDTATVNSFIGPADAIIQRGYVGAVTDVHVVKDGNGFLKIDKLRHIPDANIADYIPSAPIPPEEMFDALVEKMNGCGAVGQIGAALYEQNREQLLIWSAAMVMHHNIRGGLLYHSYRMVQLVETIAAVYPVNRDILITGAAIHDIGKLRELHTNAFGVAEYTTEGSLFGHSLLGIQMIDEVVSGFAPEFSQQHQADITHLKHMLASHHGELEFGAIVQPATSEAFLLHEADVIDSKFYSYEHETAALAPGAMSDRIYPLGKIRVYNPAQPENIEAPAAPPSNET